MRDLYKLERQGLREGIQLAKPDLLHAHWTYEFALASLETGLPTVITSHDNAFQQLRFSRDLYRLGRLYLQIRVIRQAHFVTAVSPYLASSLRWLVKTDIAMIPNAVEVPSERSDDNSHQSREPVRIATVLNGWGKRKNPKAAIKAFQLFRHEKPDTEMFMYGDGFEEGGPAAQWAARRGLGDHIHFSGFLPPRELHSQLSQMSMLLHPALEEACPMSILEAMALGLPVIGGIHSGGVPWVLDAGRSGFLTDVRKPSEIARTLLTCLEQPEDRHWRQRNAYHRVLSLFSPASVAEQYEKIYERALSTR
jgi:glycosyltransferase involved in cell wall biosynthesis